MNKNIYLYKSNKKLYDCEFQIEDIVAFDKLIKKSEDKLEIFEFDNEKMTTLFKYICSSIDFYVSLIDFYDEINHIDDKTLQEYIKNKEKNNIKNYCLYLKDEYDTEITKLEFIYKNCMIAVLNTGFITLETFKDYDKKEITKILKQLIVISIHKS